MGKNLDIGMVKHCTSSADYVNTYRTESVIETNGTINSILSRAYANTQATIVSTFVFGGLVGRNNGAVLDGMVSGSLTSTVEATRAAVTGGTGAFAYKIGFAAATAYVYNGTMIGINAGTVQGYTDTAAITVKKPDWGSDPGNTTYYFFGHTAETYYYAENALGCLIGKNESSGTVTAAGDA